MLHKNPKIISPATFKLIQELQLREEISGFDLVGGTALALQLGHRNSIDIDLFTQKDIDTVSLIENLKMKFSVTVDLERPNTLLTYVDSIKVDFIKHDYPYINPPIKEEGITFLSKEDITAMKLNAIVRSGKRLKDFIDIYFLLEYFSITEMPEFFTIKYPQTNSVIALRALDYFDEIDEAIDPPKLLYPISLKQIKNRIQEAILHSKKIFKA
jgi:hypothetical protein